jgi:hypothetical protein
MTTSTYNFEIAVSDPAIEVNAAAYYPHFPAIKAAAPKHWRLMVPYSLVAATSIRPGPYLGGGNAVATATITGSGYVGNPHTNGSQTTQAIAVGTGKVTGIAPSQQGRDWHHVDNVINDIKLQTGADITLVIGQGFPNGVTPNNAASFTEIQLFCAEVARRYGPGGPGIRTDGIYASLAGWGVTQFEINNEQNRSVYWTYAVNAQQYTQTLMASSVGIKSVLPGSQSKVIFGGMQHCFFVGIQWDTGYGYLDEFTFLQQCYNYFPPPIRSGSVTVTALATGTGALNITAAQSGRLHAIAAANGTGVINQPDNLGNYFDAMATHMYPVGDPQSPSPVQSPPNIISSQNIPAVQTSAYPNIAVLATGTGALNLTTPSQNGRLQTVAAATGTGVLNPYEPPGPVPSIWMDNFRQLIGIYGLMLQHADGNKKVKLTEFGYNVYDPNLNAQLQQIYTQQAFDLLNTLPFVDAVYLYNTVDSTNNAAPSDTSGFGWFDYNGNPRPLYNWLLTTRPTFTGGGGQTISAMATGAGTLGGAGTATVTATATGSGARVSTGGIIIATATGSGAVGPAAVAAIVTAIAHGAGAVGLINGGGSLNSGAALAVTASAVGVGQKGITPQHNGVLLVQAGAFGAGRVNVVNAAISLIAAVARGAGATGTSNQEIGVVGEVTGGADAVMATATGTGALVAGGVGSRTVTATVTGAGVVGTYGAAAPSLLAYAAGAGIAGDGGVLNITDTATGGGVIAAFGGATSSITATITGAGVLGVNTGAAKTVTATAAGAGVVGENTGGADTVTATATGGGIVGANTGGALAVTVTAADTQVLALFDSGSLTVTATGSGSGPNSIAGAGSSSIGATITGSGVVGDVGANSDVITANPAGAGYVAISTGGTQTVTATATGVGTMAATDGGAKTITGTATGTGTMAATDGGTQTATATAQGTGVVAEFTGGTQTTTATGTGAGVVGEVTGGTQTVTATATGAGAVGKVTSGTQTVTATATGAGTVAVVTATAKPHMVRVFTRHRLR